jgi:uncharacterized protein
VKIGLVGDTHGSTRNFQKVLDGPFADVELILHAGDVLYHGARNPLTERYSAIGLAEQINGLEKPILIARGNCDSDVDQAVLNVPMMSPYVFAYVDDTRLLLLHGDGQKETDLEALVVRFRLSLLIHGHSHVARVKRVGNSLIVSPGTPTIPNPSSPYKKTVGILDTTKRLVTVRDIDTGKIVLEEAFAK